MPEVKDLLEDWMRRSRINQLAHYEAAKLFNTFYYCLGIPTVVITAVLGVLNSSAKNQLSSTLTTSLLFVTAVFAALQTFLKLSERSQKHKNSGARYGALRRKIETLRVVTKIPEKSLSDLTEKMDRLATESPSIPVFIWKRTEKKLK
jgi:hypothetical protein